VGLHGCWFLPWLGVLLDFLAFHIESDKLMFDFWMWDDVLLEKRRRCLALKSSRTYSWVSSFNCSGV
jgi:hypothetical protein